MAYKIQFLWGIGLSPERTQSYWFPSYTYPYTSTTNTTSTTASVYLSGDKVKFGITLHTSWTLGENVTQYYNPAVSLGSLLRQSQEVPGKAAKKANFLPVEAACRGRLWNSKEDSPSSVSSSEARQDWSGQQL